MQKSLSGNGIIAIRRENKSKWEKRCPLSPREVEILVKNGVKVILQPSEFRCYEDEQYEQVGAIIQEDISEAGTILGLNTIQPDYLASNKTYVCFSHVCKGQKYNMKMLQHVLENNIRLIDYEKIVNENGQRLVAFGRYAGIVAMYDFLQGLGYYFINNRISSPFMWTGFAFMKDNYQKVQKMLKELSQLIQTKQLPQRFTPLIFCFVGNGRCSKGAQEVFKQLPHRFIRPEEVKNFNPDSQESRKTLYGVVIEVQDMTEPLDANTKFDKADYYKNPHKYRSTFAEKYLPYVSVIINAIYWDPRFPRMISDDVLKQYWESNNLRLLGVCDIACDKWGSIEACRIYTEPCAPFYIYFPSTKEYTQEINEETMKKGIIYHSVDIVSCELPYDSTDFFGTQLLPFIESIAKSDATQDLENQNLPDEIKRAVIACNNKLMPKYEYIQEFIESNIVEEREKAMKATHSQSPYMMKKNFQHFFKDFDSALQELSESPNLQLQERQAAQLLKEFLS